MPVCPEVPPSVSFPLSPAQEGMLYLSLANEGSGAYIEQIVFRLREPLDAPLFIESCQLLVAAHAVLRVYFAWEDLAEARQFVASEASASVAQHDWRGRPAEQAAEDLEAFLETDRVAGFDLATPPLVRFAIIYLGDSSVTVLVTVHHLLVDGRSICQMAEELFARYEAARSGSPYVPPRAAPFSDYVDWVRDLPRGPAETFWRRHLDGVDSPSPIPLPSPEGRDIGRAAYQQIHIEFEASLSGALKAFAASHGLTLNILFLGAWAVLLHRYTESSQLVLGVTKSVRHGKVASPSSFGVFINTLPVRTSLDGNLSWIPWLSSLREQWMALRDFDHTSPKLIRACSSLHGGAPLFDAHYVFERETIPEALGALGGPWTAREVRLLQRTPLPLILAGYGGKHLCANIEFDADRFRLDDMSRMLGHFKALLESLVREPDACPATVAFLTETERAQAWASAPPPTPAAPPTCIHRLVERVAAERPGAPAVQSGNIVLTYHELNERASVAARHLRECGVRSESRVAISMMPSEAMIVGVLAILKAGGVCVPMDPSIPLERLQFMLADSQADVVLTDPDFAGRFDGGPCRVTCLPAADAPTGDTDLEDLATPDSLAYIIYTSGSTGRPKGVCVAHREAASHFEIMRDAYTLRDDDRMLLFASLSFDASFEQMFVTLTGGGALVVTDAHALLPTEFSTFIRDMRVSVLDIPPAFWQQWMDEGMPGGLEYVGPQFRVLALGGDVLPVESLRQWRKIPGNASVRLLNAYGPTETVVTATVFEVPSEFGQDPSAERIPIGFPLPGTELYVLDRHRNLVPKGLPGELYIGGNRLARGYWNRPELTEERFVPHPFTPKPGARLYRTGDLVLLREDGALEFLGRIDHQVKIRGFRIELGEIEAVLLGHPAIRDAAVIRCEDRPGDAYLAAYVVAVEERSLDASALRAHLRLSLPDYMMPSVFMFMEALPRLLSGKVDRKGLPAPARDSAKASPEDPEEPHTDLERILVGIWEEILRVDRVRVHDNFFDIGGHSLLAMRVLSRMRDALQVTLPLRTFILHPTIEGLVQAIHEAAPESAQGFDPCIVVLRGTGTKPPLFCALGAGGAAFSYSALAKHLDASQPVYGLQYSHLPDFEQFATVESVAARYIEAICTVQPEGPYHIAGWSYGGVVAYEIAQQLITQGAEVALLAVIDCQAKVPSPPSLSRYVGRFRHHVTRNWKRIVILASNRETVMAYARDLLRLMLKKKTAPGAARLSIREYIHFAISDIRRVYAMKQSGIDVPEAHVSRLGMLEDTFVRRVIAGFRANERAAAAYRMRPYPGPLTLFRTEDTPLAFARNDLTLGFKDLASRVDVRMLEGHHLMLVREPYVTVLAKSLQECLDALPHAASVERQS